MIINDKELIDITDKIVKLISPLTYDQVTSIFFTIFKVHPSGIKMLKDIESEFLTRLWEVS